MAEYIAFDPNVEVRGILVEAFFLAEGDSIRPILQELGVTRIDPYGWYPHQWVLDLFREVAQREGGSMNLVHIGAAIPEQAEFPPHVDNVEAALNLLDAMYHLHHRGGEAGDYQVSRVASHHLAVTCHTPYPSDYDYGLIYALTKRFRPRRSGFVVRRDDDAPSRITGGDTCLFHVTWE